MDFCFCCCPCSYHIIFMLILFINQMVKLKLLVSTRIKNQRGIEGKIVICTKRGRHGKIAKSTRSTKQLKLIVNVLSSLYSYLHTYILPKDPKRLLKENKAQKIENIINQIENHRHHFYLFKKNMFKCMSNLNSPKKCECHLCVYTHNNTNNKKLLRIMYTSQKKKTTIMPAGFRIKFISKHKTGVSHTIQENPKKTQNFITKKS